MDKRDPFAILDIAPGTEWSVIKAAYVMLVSRVEGIRGTETEEQLDALAEIEWAYRELKDPERRLMHYRRHCKGIDGKDDEFVSSETGGRSRKRVKWRTITSVLVSGAMFSGMLGAIGYGLYVVGAVRPELGSAISIGVTSSDMAEPTETPGPNVLAKEMPEIGHTATVEALYATATRAALVDYTTALTATIEAVRLALTPTPVQLRACPNVASVNVRTGAGTGYRAIGYVLEGDCVSVTGRNGPGDWLVISNAPRPSSDGGWVSASLMTIEGEIEGLSEVETE